MILTGKQIEDEVSKGRITLEPFTEQLVNPNSYNYRLGPVLCEFSDEVIDPRHTPVLKQHIIPEEGFVLLPNKLYLGHTLEIIGSDEYVTSLIGRSSVGRLGLFLQITADLGQLGKAHQWTLELKVVQPLRVYAGIRIGQVSFWQPKGHISSTYDHGYTAHNQPFHNRYALGINS